MPLRYARFILMLTVAACAPASAQQLYKWVDERGVTNYSNHPPADPKSAKNVRPVEDRLSVYSPDPGLTQAIEDNQKNFDQRQRERARIEAMERQAEAERQAREQRAAAARQAQEAYDRIASRDKTLIWNTRGGHVVAADEGRDDVVDHIVQWLDARVALDAPAVGNTFDAMGKH